MNTWFEAILTYLICVAISAAVIGFVYFVGTYFFGLPR